MSEEIKVVTRNQNNYSIYIGADLDHTLLSFSRQYVSDKAFVVIDERVHELHFDRIRQSFATLFKQIEVFKVPRGEQSKNARTYLELCDFILNSGADRSTPLFAIGGGVTGDLAGFAAATVLRGLPLIHMPTTLLAMVDSSIGGKTGVNHDQGKNLLGSFYQPDAVFADLRFLETLEPGEWVNGISEVLKYGMIEDPDILMAVEELTAESDADKADSFGSPLLWQPVIRRSAQIKTDIVGRDVHEAGERAYLNFGHTYGHVLERIGGYKQYSHGEAVYAGMVAAVHASNACGAGINPEELLKFSRLYSIDLKSIQESAEELTQLMQKDKKVKNNQVRLILLSETGKPYLKSVEETAFVEASWNYMLKQFTK